MRGRVAYGTRMADLTNAQIAAALDELGDLYELDGAVSYRVIAYRNAAKAVRESSVSIIGDDARGPRDRACPGIGKTLEEKLRALDETGDIPALGQAARQVPARADRGHAPAGLRAQARPASSTTSSGSTRSTRCARRSRRARSGSCAASALKAEDAAQARRSPTTRRPAGRRRACVLSRAMAIAEQIVGALRAHPASDRVEVAGSLRRRADSVKDLDIIATASDPKALAAHARRARARGVGAVLGRRGRARDAPTPA